MAQPGSALGLGPRGRWFESSYPDYWELIMYIIEYYWKNPDSKINNSGWYPVSKHKTYAEAKKSFEELMKWPAKYKYQLRNSKTGKVRTEFEHPDLGKVEKKKTRKKRKRSRKNSS